MTRKLTGTVAKQYTAAILCYLGRHFVFPRQGIDEIFLNRLNNERTKSVEQRKTAETVWTFHERIMNIHQAAIVFIIHVLMNIQCYSLPIGLLHVSLLLRKVLHKGYNLSCVFVV